MKATVCGASGFIGTTLCEHLRGLGWEVVELSRAATRGKPSLGDFAAASERLLKPHFERSDLVINLAGRAHRADAGKDRSLTEIYHLANVTLAERLYRLACDAHCGRFVQFSTIKVLGEVADQPLPEDAPYYSLDVYSQSKRDAEIRLAALSKEGIPVTIVRPPLVYGPGVKGNFARLIKLVADGWPIPLGGASALRSIVSVTNLSDLVARFADDDVPLRIAHVRDREDLDVAHLVDLIAGSLGRRARLVAVPPAMMKSLCWLAGQSHAYTSLFEPLRVDDARTRKAFGWSPPAAVARSVDAAVNAWRACR